jgi:cysteinyl-tRNA synthetase
MIILRGIERNKDLSDGQKRAIFEDTDQLFGLDLLRSPETPPLGAQVEELLRQRDDARRSKDFALSDRLRDQISEFGITVKDTADGQVWEYK